MSEKCDRCGSIGDDRRTLQMACLYEMNELKIPFGQIAITGQLKKMVGEETKTSFGKINFTNPKYGPLQQESRDYPFYTLRVCKRCRAEWLEAIKTWFNTTPKGQDSDAD